MKPRMTLFERLISNPRRPWITIGAILVLSVIPFVGAFLGGFLDELLASGAWRGAVAAPAVILYIVAIAPSLERMGSRVLDALRPLLLVDDSAFEQLVIDATAVSLRNETLAIGVGLSLGIVEGIRSYTSGISWFSLYVFTTSCLMYGLLAWTIYMAIRSSRLTGVLLRQPMRFDPFDLTPFEAVGRQSLLLALVFVGGIMLSLLLSSLTPEVLLDLRFWLVYIPLVVAPVIIFFLNMLPTHRVLAASQASQRQAIQVQLHRAGTALLGRLEAGEDTGTLSQEITALTAMEQRLHSTRTWPYNTDMLRTLFVSLLAPLIVALTRLVLDRLAG